MATTTSADQRSPILSREHLRRAIRGGGVIGAVLVFVALIGAFNAFTLEPIVRGLISLTQVVLAFGGLGAGSYAQATMTAEERRPVRLLAAGALAGAVAMLCLSLLALLVNAVNMRAVLVNATPELVTVLTLGLPLGAGVVALPVVGAVLGAIGGLWSLVPRQWRRVALFGIGTVLIFGVLRENGLGLIQALVLGVFVGALSYGATLARPIAAERYRQAQRQRGDLVRWGTYAVAAVVLLLLPQLLGIYGTSVIDLVGLYVLMGLGLNIVVGYAGLLNLGYVAFFAIGAYTTSLLTSPVASAHLGMNFWLALPIAMVVTAVAAAALAVPVLRMRGDYLAIVTLGFGEIIRILVLSDSFKGVLGGAQGIIEVPSPALLGTPFTRPEQFYYLILIGCV
ncbi:MAG: ABC transporter permease subunit, partial [Anaerolineae bacterium]